MATTSEVPTRTDSFQTLRGEVKFLGDLLGNTIREIAGESALALVEDVRKLAWQRRCGDPQSEQALCDKIRQLDQLQLRIVIRAFTLFLDLLNLCEDRQRVRTLNARRAKSAGSGLQESVSRAIGQLGEHGISGEALASLVDRLQIELVFTAHPTEAKRRSVRSKLRRLRELMSELDAIEFPELTRQMDGKLQAEMAKLWLTDFVRQSRPTVMQEVARGLSFKPVLWDEVPQLMSELRTAMSAALGRPFEFSAPPLSFGSWIGGDRDGHPGVTAEITRTTLSWLREAALDFHLQTCQQLRQSLSLSERQLPHAQRLGEAVAESLTRWPALAATVAEIPANELCRKWLSIIQWRLQQSLQIALDHPRVDAAYCTFAEFRLNVVLLKEVVQHAPGGRLIVSELQSWLDQIDVFGFHLAKLDVRQDSRQYRAALDEIWRLTGICGTPEQLDDGERFLMLEATLDKSLEIDRTQLSASAQETLSLFELLHKTLAVFGPSSIGGHVVSMTHHAADLLTVLWFWRQTRPQNCAPTSGDWASMRMMPLFETIDDLQRAAEILQQLLRCPAYREVLAAQGDEQMVMLGYSDSTKDGGYLSACWSLHEAQRNLTELSREYGVSCHFFHGRGGSLGRGGGPAARSILSLPKGTFHGAMRLTEQGEVLAERYDDAMIAHRHLEQVLWSSLLAAGQARSSEPAEWYRVMERLSYDAGQAYRHLVERQGFVQFFRSATPISEVEQLPIGSRPSRRRGGSTLSDLRAIPWVFSWTQCRCLIPAWYGLGQALEQALQDQSQLKLLREMYANWPFLRATIDNAELALAKTDIEIAKHYFQLAAAGPEFSAIRDDLLKEYARAKTGVLSITEKQDLLDSTPWLQEAIRVRNRYVDPLNVIQVVLLERASTEESKQTSTNTNATMVEEPSELRVLARLTVNGIAAGMRTSG
ncbi:MAG: phosphoenolpyruvate carboxylase [Planctomycetales bacterium]|nr:phosphoenolpyruvate carboxylase [Planctomycetales bacterium]